ncbi:alpha/beta fold hydrolase [Pseudonocardia sp. RS010]|uniref:alpha/beta fold hydrolase n=1 Tax=Pseudonocardia sp. RS010 TaxID=3385979 RepID=UPI0039A32B87
MTATTTGAEELGAPPGRLVPAGDYELFVSEVGDGGRSTVFLHGGGPGCTSWTDFGVAIPYFDDRRCVLVDLLNFGYSSAAEYPADKWAFHAKHVAAALENLGIENADFVCNSQGGSVALVLAADYSHLVRKVVLSGSEPLFRGRGALTPELGDLIGQLVTDFTKGEGPTREKIREIMIKLEYWDPAAVNETTLDLRWHYLQQPGPASTWGSGSVRAGDPEDLEALLAEVKRRVLVLWGRYDVFGTPAYALSIADAVPYGDVFLMDQGGHHMEEERPQDFAAIVKTWLDLPADTNQ